MTVFIEFTRGWRHLFFEIPSSGGKMNVKHLTPTKVRKSLRELFPSMLVNKTATIFRENKNLSL